MFSSHRLLLAAAIAVPLGLVALAGWLNFDRIRGESERDALHNARALSEHALRTLRSHELILDFADAYVAGRSWSELQASEGVHRMLVRLKGTGDDVASVFLLGPDGTLFVSSRRFPMPRFNATDRDYFKALAKEDGLFIGEAARSRLVDERFFTMARRKSAPAGRFDGIIAVSVSPSYFENFFASLLDEEQAASLVRADGAVLARNPDVKDGPSVLPPGSAFMRQIAAHPEAGVYGTRSLTDGLDRIIAYQRVGTYPVYASFQLSMASVWSEWRHAMLPYGLAGLFAMALLLAGVAFAEQRTRRAAAEARSREAEAASRAKDMFVATLSHELRNPLAAISNASQVLKYGGLSAPGAHTASEIIERQITQLRRLLDDLLDSARAVYGKLTLQKRRLDLRPIADTVAAEHGNRAGAAISVRQAGADAWVEADPVRIKQMLDNLVENAVKYGARQVSIVVETGNGAVQVTVQDDGQGIQPELLPRLFQPFVQGEQSLDRAKGGLGLGLALVHRLAALHGGTLSAASAGPGQGSTFTLRLPRAEPPARPAEVSTPEADTGRRLLVVEDEADARESLRTLLELHGHEVLIASDGPTGLRHLDAAAVDVALLDIGLPGLDGYALARDIKRRFPALRIVAVTGYGQREDRERAREAGFDAHLTKPFSYEELMHAIASMTAERVATG
jgi:signal transduction histidine kinase/ActR/RegA family two-component response regulator